MDHEPDLAPVAHVDRDPAFVGFVRRVGLVVAVVIVVLALWRAQQVLLIFFFGCLLAVALHRGGAIISRLTRMPRRLATVLTFVLALVVIVGGGVVFGSQIANQIQQLVARLPASRDALAGFLAQFGIKNVGLNSVLSTFASSAADMLGSATSIVSGGVSYALNVIFVLFVCLFLALDPARYRDGLVRLVPPTGRERSRHVLDEAASQLGTWLVGQLMLMVMIGAAAMLGLGLLGLPLFAALGVIAGVLEFVPVIGPIVAALPAILIGFTVSPAMGLYVALLYLAINQLEGNVLLPLVQQREVELPPLLTMAAVIAFGAIFGFMGLVIAVPLLVVLKVFIERLYIEDVLEKRPANDGCSAPRNRARREPFRREDGRGSRDHAEQRIAGWLSPAAEPRPQPRAWWRASRQVARRGGPRALPLRLDPEGVGPQREYR